MKSQITLFISVLVLSILNTGCFGESSKSPAAAPASSISLQSGTFTPPAKVSAKAGALAISDFSFCVTQLKFEGADGSNIVDGSDDLFEARIGLVSPNDGSVIVNWGDASFPAGTQISKVKVEIHHDPETCNGADYSVSYNGQALQQDVELTFTFAADVVLIDGDVINLDLTNIVNAFQSAYLAGQFSDMNINSYIETIEDAAE